VTKAGEREKEYEDKKEDGKRLWQCEKWKEIKLRGKDRKGELMKKRSACRWKCRLEP